MTQSFLQTQSAVLGGHLFLFLFRHLPGIEKLKSDRGKEQFSVTCYSFTPWFPSSPDAMERERLAQHSALRELVTRNDVSQLKSRLATLGGAAGLIVNMTPGGANTLLYM